MSSKYLVAVLVLLSGLMVPNPAMADNGTDFSNSGGMLSGTNAGLTLSGSMLIGVTGNNGGNLATGNLGTVAISLDPRKRFAPARGHLRSRWNVHCRGERKRRTRERCTLLRSILGTSDLDACYAGERHPQLHANRRGDWNDGRIERQRGRRSIDDQHREGFF